jgi:hypothetical protein
MRDWSVPLQSMHRGQGDNQIYLHLIDTNTLMDGQPWLMYRRRSSFGNERIQGLHEFL